MANDPGIPNDIKKRNNGVRAGALPNSMYPQPSQFDNVRSGTAVNDGTVPITPDAVSAGPQRAGVVDASRQAPPSPLDANQPLPTGVRQVFVDQSANRPGTNDVIYEGRGAHGERSFSNNQFASTLTGRAPGMNPGLDALARSRSGEIDAYTGAQTAAANAAAGAAAIAPKTAGEQSDRLKVLADIANNRALLPGKVRGADLDAIGKEGENISNDPLTKTSTAVRDAAIKAGATPEAAVLRGGGAAAIQALDSGMDPSDKTLPPDARAGFTGMNRGLANLINTKATTGFSGGFGDRTGLIDDPDRLNPANLELGETPLTHYPTLRGPKDKNGNARQVVLSPDEAATYAPYIRAHQAASLRRPLLSDRK